MLVRRASRFRSNPAPPRVAVSTDFIRAFAQVMEHSVEGLICLSSSRPRFSSVSYGFPSSRASTAVSTRSSTFYLEDLDSQPVLVYSVKKPLGRTRSVKACGYLLQQVTTSTFARSSVYLNTSPYGPVPAQARRCSCIVLAQLFYPVGSPHASGIPATAWASQDIFLPTAHGLGQRIPQPDSVSRMRR